ncbi:hypothetical protein ACLOJK_017829 [Asimina triloba]
MDGNKDEALRCVGIAQAALASGDKIRALKFIKIARRLDPTVPVTDLMSAAEKLGSDPSAKKPLGNCSEKESVSKDYGNCPNGYQKNFNEDHVRVVREIKRCKGYYEILGLEKSCSADEVRRAYRKLSLKVHPDKNNAPGSEDAFKMVSKAFKCLSNEESRRQYDQMGFIGEFECSEQHNFRRRPARRAPRRDVFNEDLDPDEVFRSFFFGSQSRVYRNPNVHRAAREMRRQRRENEDVGGFNSMLLIQILPVLIIMLVACLPFSDVDLSLQKKYSLQKNYLYPIPKVTDKHGVEFYVKSDDFDHQFPVGTTSRLNLEHRVLRDYKIKLRHNCHVETQKRQGSRTYPRPHCDKLRDLGVV